MTNYELSRGVERGMHELLRQHQAEGLKTPFTGAAVETVPHSTSQTSSPETEIIAEAPAQAFSSSMARRSERGPRTAPAHLSATTAATNSLRAVFRGLFPTKNLR